MRRGTNLPKMGDFNQTVILDAIRRSGQGLSRVELVGAVGLAPQTVSNIVRRLLDAGLVTEAGKTSGGAGKPRTTLRVHAAGSYAVGVQLDPAVTTSVLLDLMGNVVARRIADTPHGNNPAQVLTAITSQVASLLTETGVDRGRVAGLGVATPGPIDRESGTVLDPPNLPGWHRVPLRSGLASSTGLPVLIEKDVSAAAAAEIWVSGRRSTPSFLFVYIGTGIGCAVALDGEVLHGVSGNAGEIGHLVTDASGPECSCGQRGCVAVTCTPRSLVRAAHGPGSAPAVPPGAPDSAITAAFLDICRSAVSGDEAAARLVDRAAVRTANAVATLAAVYDVDRVIFGGPFWSPLSARYLAAVPAALADRPVPGSRPIEVSATVLGEDVTAVGAACLVLDRALGPRRERLLLEG
ncbi:ROK family transcriptional regulator [Arthrobacter yangruifuii]|nr:ROK family transcriptional regulator [Arthrobacter yangruifuii]